MAYLGKNMTKNSDLEKEKRKGKIERENRI
jgi:hypothetical protein